METEKFADSTFCTESTVFKSPAQLPNFCGSQTLLLFLHSDDILGIDNAKLKGKK